MRRWSRSTFVFVSTNPTHTRGGVEERWLDVMAALVEQGATVQFLCFADSPLADRARSLGANVAPYMLDRWNVIRSRSRLRKYLRRYEPVCAHSTGLEADLLLRWAARKVAGVCIATTLTLDEQQHTRRRRPIDALMYRFDETGLSREDAVFVESDELLGDVQSAGVPPERVVLDPPATDAEGRRESVARHLDIYRRFLAEKGT